MTIFVTHGHYFTTFRKCLIAKEILKHNSSCLKAIVVESQLEINYSRSNGCYNIELALYKLFAMTVNFWLLPIHFMYVVKATKLFYKGF